MTIYEKLMDVVKQAEKRTIEIDNRVAEIEEDIRKNGRRYNYNDVTEKRAEVVRLTREKVNTRTHVQERANAIISEFIRAESEKPEMRTTDLDKDSIALLYGGALSPDDIRAMYVSCADNHSMQKAIYNYCVKSGIVNDMRMRYIPHSERVKTALKGVPYTCAVLSTLKPETAEYQKLSGIIADCIGDHELYDIGASVEMY